MPSPGQILKKRISEDCSSHIPKGELWLGTELFKESGLEDTVANHVVLAKRLNQDVVCLPVSAEGAERPDLGYRYFSIPDLRKGIEMGVKPVFAVIDGPFQEMVNSMGLMDVLSGWASEPEEIEKAYKAESEKRIELILQATEHPLAAVVITDDMAFDSGPLISPSDLDALCTPFYKKAVKHIHGCGIPVLLHSCGNIGKLIAMFKSWEIDGFAAIQTGMNDLESLYREFGSEVIFLAGIESDLLDARSFPEPSRQTLEHLMAVLGSTGSLILGSSCGLYKGEYLEQIRKIYSFAEKKSV